MEPRSAGRAAVGREGFLEKAEELFTERGYRAVSIRDIAQACEVSNAALYYHFPSKEALFREVMARHVAVLGARMALAGQGAGAPRQRVEAMLLEYTRIAADRRSPFFLLRREPEVGEQAHFRELVGRWMRAMLKPLDDVLQAAVEAGELRPLPRGTSPAALLVGMLHGLVQHHLACGAGETIGQAEIAVVVSVFWDGLRRPDASSSAPVQQPARQMVEDPAEDPAEIPCDNPTG